MVDDHVGSIRRQIATGKSSLLYPINLTHSRSRTNTKAAGNWQSKAIKTMLIHTYKEAGSRLQHGKGWALSIGSFGKSFIARYLSLLESSRSAA